MRKKAAARKVSSNPLFTLLSGFYPLLLISALGIVIYSNSFGCSFHFDDIDNIIDNHAIHDIRDVKGIWNYINQRFIGYASFALNYHFNRLDVFGYHLVNLLIHVGAALFTWWLVLLILSTPVMQKQEISRHKRLIALGCALIFISHPLQTQAVTYIVQRLASLAALFYLASLSFYIKARLVRGNIGIIYFCCSAFAALLGIFTKENLFTLPFAIVLCEIYFFSGGIKGLLQNIHKPKFLIAIILFLLFLLVIPFLFSFDVINTLGTAVSQRHLDPPLSSSIYLFTQFRVIVKYIRLLFLPLNQNLDYDFPASHRFVEPRTLLSFLFLVFIVIIAVRIFSRHRLASFGILWFFLALSVESSIKALGNVIFEHRLYLPMFGFSLVLTSTLYQFLWKRHAKTAVIIVLVLTTIYSIMTYQRNKVWKNDITLWNDVIKKSPDKARPHLNLGLAYEFAGLAEEAKKQYIQALKLYPNYTDAYYNLGNVFYNQGANEEAKKLYQNTIRIDPAYARAYLNLGNAYFREGNLEEAKKQYYETLRFLPDDAIAYNNLGLVFYKENQVEEAKKMYYEAIHIDPGYAKAYLNLGIAFYMQGSVEDAIREFNKALNIDPDNFEVHKNLGVSLSRLGKIDEAYEHFYRAFTINPNYETHYYLGLNLLEQGKIDEAIKHFFETIRQKPDYIDAHSKLAMCYQMQGKITEAQVHIDEAEKLRKKLMQ